MSFISATTGKLADPQFPDPVSLTFNQIDASSAYAAAESIKDYLVAEDLVFERLVVARTRAQPPPDPTIGPWG